jgi:hypothetical protein
MRNDLSLLKTEINGISMVDEFAKYAKLQRKYNKLEDKAKESRNYPYIHRTFIHPPFSNITHL